MSLLDQTPPDLIGTKRTVVVPEPVTSARAQIIRNLVRELRQQQFTASQIGVALGVTEQYARLLLVELGLHLPRRYASASHAIEALPHDIRKRLEQFRNQSQTFPKVPPGA